MELVPLICPQVGGNDEWYVDASDQFPLFWGQKDLRTMGRYSTPIDSEFENREQTSYMPRGI